MKKGDLYPIGTSHSVFGPQNNYRIQFTGEHRPPRINEWFLSGAIMEYNLDIEGFIASHNMTEAYPIGKLVKVKIETIVTVVEEL